MPLPICSLMSMTGIRRTSSSDSYNVIVEAYHPISLGDIDRVEFSISSNGGSATVTTVTSRAMWKPDDTTYDDPLPGSWGGGPTYIWSYGVKIEMASYAAGYIDIVPTVYAGSGESKTLSTIRIYNDKDGTDRRPSPKAIYWDYINGNDSNSGLSSGLAKKSFEKAAEAAATSSDCGGAIIYVDSAGDHQIRGSNYGQNGNLYTSGHHWLQVLPRAGLSREDVRIVRIPSAEDFDFRWMYFKGTTSTPGLQQARIRFSNLTIINSGFKIGTWSHLYMSLWVDHCLNGPPPPYLDPVLGTGVHIRSIETIAGCIDLVNKKDGIDKIFITGSTRRCSIGGGQWGDIVRGCLIDKFAGQVFQPQYKDSALTNILVKDIFQEVGVSGRFVATGSFRIESQGGSNYRIQANAGYAGRDFIPDLAYITGSPRLGLRLENFTNSSNNNMAIDLLSGGYSGSLPWVDVSTTRSANGLTPESDASAIITNGDFNNPTTNYNTWGPHSDIFQFVEIESYPVSNTIISNFAVFRSYETQGIYKYDDCRLSGIAFINYYDGGIGEGPRSYYWFGTPPTAKNILIRNSYISRLEVSSTDDIENSEIIDTAMGLISAPEGSLTAYTGIVNVTHNHWTGSQTVGGSSSNGLYFASSTPALSTNATVSPSSTAYGTASSTWARPSAWFSGNKGPWNNVALADWSYTESTGGGGSGGSVDYTGSVNATFSIQPSIRLGLELNQNNLSSVSNQTDLGLSINYNTSLIVSTSNLIESTKAIQVNPDSLSSTSVTSNISLGVKYSTEDIKTVINQLNIGTYVSEIYVPVLENYSILPTPTVVVSVPFSSQYSNSIVLPITTFTNSTITDGQVNTVIIYGPDGYSLSNYVQLGIDESTLLNIALGEVTIGLTAPTIVTPESAITLIQISEIEGVITTSNPIIENELELESGNQSYIPPQFFYTPSQSEPRQEEETLRLIKQLNFINGNLNNLPTEDRQSWTQNVIDNISNKESTRYVINLMTSNYRDLQRLRKNQSSRTLKNR